MKTTSEDSRWTIDLLNVVLFVNMIGLLATALLLCSCNTSLVSEGCMDVIRGRSASNPIRSLLKVPLDSIAELGTQSGRILMKDSTYTREISIGRVLVCTSDSSDGLVSYYTRDSVLYQGVGWGAVQFYRYRLRSGNVSILPCSTTIAIAGNSNNPIPQWEKYDEYAIAFLIRNKIVSDECMVVDSMVIAPDGVPASQRFHQR